MSVRVLRNIFSCAMFAPWLGEELNSTEHNNVFSSYEWFGVTVDARNTKLGSRIVVCSFYLSACLSV